MYFSERGRGYLLTARAACDTIKRYGNATRMGLSFRNKGACFMYSGVSTASLFLREMNEDALSVLDGLGVRSTEVFLTTLSEYTEEFAHLLNERKGREKSIRCIF